ncbi:hypothetical protein BWQ96_01615 [Gracilariopsis chorda]|uniref:J domain-containing protein n=1 Tax=Gracilariopsis chorda TaxID=448386 RepID=A0A2V3IEH8_9FLOR|nr:hypothetical protein BWQ96_10701 [Gracilariopsis chorda]PXF48446.1 hypothetical protein BWQ96_01615 [Gracilariopsis chorda]|eukprot:PXF39600.1 hypothetical protein BWQ96_10701 [Gracilariopsis chorda]
MASSVLPSTTYTAFSHIENTDDCTTLAELFCLRTQSRLSMFRKSFLRLSLLVHPDRGGNDDPERAKECMQIISRGFEQAENEALITAWGESEAVSGDFLLKRDVYFCLRTSEREKE